MLEDSFVQDLIKIVLTSLCSSGAMSLLVYKVQRHDRLKDEAKANDTALSLMVRGLCHDKIIYLTDKYIERGGITSREKASLEAIYTPYRKGGGNGDCKAGFEAVKVLPVIPEHEARARDIEVSRRLLMRFEEGVTHD